ncbi:MAG: DNA polymerase III subunit gamma/tau [Nitrincola sp.]|nr:DNA polymerase III subunit gamma/tau [Nitrincola sp.]
MSYQVLARKWRPRKFSEMVGQEHVLRALVNALDNDRLHHAYLFTGTRGVGKTSIARLFAKALNCEEGVSSEPCGVCTACREIAEGRFVDLIEVDAASRTKVEDTRELLENVQYAPSHGRYKVYLIDEVHMLTNHSFNALLKTLEEPPPHVKFLLATTDPQKLPITVLSRCLQFNLKNLSPQRIVEHLHFVLTQEQISFDDPALWLLARSADGSMRDALSLTDQAIAFGSGSINEGDVRNMLGTIDQQLVYEILTALTQRDARRVIAAVQTLSEFSPDYSAVLADLISLLHRVALGQVLPNAIDNSLGDQQQIMQLAKLLSPEDVQLFYQIGLMGRKDLPYAPDLREGLEMVLLRMLAFRPVQLAPRAEQPVIESYPEESSELSPSPAKEEHLSVSPEVQTKSVVPSEPTPVSEQDVPPWEDIPVWASEGNSEPIQPESDVVKNDEIVQPNFESIATDPIQSIKSEQSPPKKSETAEPSQAVSLGSLSLENWVILANELPLTGMTASICRNLSLEHLDDKQLVFHFTPEQGALMNATQQDRIKEALETHLGMALAVSFVQSAQTRETPAQFSQRKKAERQAEAVVSMQKDPVVQRIIEEFSAELLTESVKPIDEPLNRH